MLGHGGHVAVTVHREQRAPLVGREGDAALVGRAFRETESRSVVGDDLAYRDDAIGTMGKTERGAAWVARVVLAPQISYGGDKQPTAEDIARLHHAAHDGCFIANSVKTEIVVA